MEQKTRIEIVLKIDHQKRESVDKALEQLYEQIGNQVKTIFKTITSDNGSEFAGIHEMLKKQPFFCTPLCTK